jgi:hypothetical protein
MVPRFGFPVEVLAQRECLIMLQSVQFPCISVLIGSNVRAEELLRQSMLSNCGAVAAQSRKSPSC